MDLEIGAKRPIDGSRVFKVGRYANNEPSFVELYDPTGDTPLTRYPRRRLKGIDPESVVEQLGGSAAFARINTDTGDTFWLRRAMIRSLEEMPPASLRYWGPKARFGTMILASFDPPMVQHPDLPPDTPVTLFMPNCTVDQVQAMIRQKIPDRQQPT